MSEFSRWVRRHPEIATPIIVGVVVVVGVVLAYVLLTGLMGLPQ